MWPALCDITRVLPGERRPVLSSHTYLVLNCEDPREKGVWRSPSPTSHLKQEHCQWLAKPATAEHHQQLVFWDKALKPVVLYSPLWALSEASAEHAQAGHPPWDEEGVLPSQHVSGALSMKHLHGLVLHPGLARTREGGSVARPLGCLCSPEQVRYREQPESASSAEAIACCHQVFVRQNANAAPAAPRWDAPAASFSRGCDSATVQANSHDILVTSSWLFSACWCLRLFTQAGDSSTPCTLCLLCRTSPAGRDFWNNFGAAQQRLEYCGLAFLKSLKTSGGCKH